MVMEPSQWVEGLLKALERVVAEYVLDQVWNGVNVVQIFEAMGITIKGGDNDNKEEGKMVE